ncbi:MAG TPA: hypothetical protein VM582_09545, partial [Candidatus Thermoplasmatota archaeon]|nr:hypothetical protein [Candidatus Thermoplasmatota archaeon]
MALRVPRGPLAAALALLPALALVAVAFAWPAVTEAERVRDTFARYISGLITAATIAVGFATLSLRRGIKGLGELREHVEADRQYAARVAEMVGREPPVGVGPALVLVLEAAAARARELRAEDLARHADQVATTVRDAGGDPERLLMAALELDAERAMHEAREALDDERLAGLLEMANIGRLYAKTLATQWSISRMSQAIALTSIAAVVVATGTVLAYEPSAASPYVLGFALGAVLLPLAVFVSYAMRFTFVNQHTLPIGHFVLGPENPRALHGSARHK